MHSKTVQVTKHGGVAKDHMPYMPCRGCEIGQEHSKLVKLSKKLKSVRLGRAMNGTAA